MSQHLGMDPPLGLQGKEELVGEPLAWGSGGSHAANPCSREVKSQQQHTELTLEQAWGWPLGTEQPGQFWPCHSLSEPENEP